MILAALLIAAAPCSRPVIEPQAGHGLFTHIRRLESVCIPGEVAGPVAVEPLVSERLIAFEPLAPAVTPLGLAGLPQGPEDERGRGSEPGPGSLRDGGPVGGGVYVSLPAAPEPATWLGFLGGILVLCIHRRKR